MNAKTVTAFRTADQSVLLREGDVLEGGDVLVGFNLNVKDFFARLPV